jgi:hypothetical protein
LGLLVVSWQDPEDNEVGNGAEGDSDLLWFIRKQAGDEENFLLNIQEDRFRKQCVTKPDPTEHNGQSSKLGAVFQHHSVVFRTVHRITAKRTSEHAVLHRNCCVISFGTIEPLLEIDQQRRRRRKVMACYDPSLTQCLSFG